MAPVFTGILVWMFTERRMRRLNNKCIQTDVSSIAVDDRAELPLTVKFEGELPIGYYKISRQKAKRMEPKFYAQLQDYLSQVWGIVFFAFVLVVAGVVKILAGNATLQDLNVFMVSSIVLLALFPWRVFFGNYD